MKEEKGRILDETVEYTYSKLEKELKINWEITSENKNVVKNFCKETCEELEGNWGKYLRR